jgi:hypothetical protein
LAIRAAAFLLFVLASLTVDGISARSPTQPFASGERAEYDVRYGVIHAGAGALTVVGIDTVRGRDAYRFRMTFSAAINLLLYRYSTCDTMESWVDTATFHSLRFRQDQVTQGKPRIKRYEIFPERRAYSDGGQAEEASVAEPLDDISFLYFVRTQPLIVGTTTDFARHFKPKSNPVTLKVIRKDTIEAGGKQWATILVQPIIKTSTMFSDGSEARVWLSDDSARVIVQIHTRLKVGSLTMTLRSYQATAAAPPRIVMPRQSLNSRHATPRRWEAHEHFGIVARHDQP